MLKIRLQRKGRKKRPFYYIVVADSKSKRDGKFLEKIGVYDTMKNPSFIFINEERSLYWMEKGAQPTKTTKSILSKKGILLKKHLLRLEKNKINKINKINNKKENFFKNKKNLNIKKDNLKKDINNKKNLNIKKDNLKKDINNKKNLNIKKDNLKKDINNKKNLNIKKDNLKKNINNKKN